MIVPEVKCTLPFISEQNPKVTRRYALPAYVVLLAGKVTLHGTTPRRCCPDSQSTVGVGRWDRNSQGKITASRSYVINKFREVYDINL